MTPTGISGIDIYAHFGSVALNNQLSVEVLEKQKVDRLAELKHIMNYVAR